MMKFSGLTLSTPAENLALDEALLDAADGVKQYGSSDWNGPAAENNSDSSNSWRSTCQVLRIWHALRPFVVIGRSSQAAREVDLVRARQMDVPVLRRFSGGSAVAVAPGCLLYSLLIDLESAPRLRMLDVAHRYVMDRMLQAIRQFEPNASIDGTSDLVIDGRKFSGNSLRIGRRWMLYHGTLLLHMDLSILDELLLHPPREPTYRFGRKHKDFVTNLNLRETEVIDSIRKVWQACEELQPLPTERVPLLVKERYGQDSWNLLR